MTEERQQGELLDINQFLKDNNIHDADGPPRATDNSDSRYVSLVAGGIKPEGEDFPDIYVTKALATEAYLKSLKDWLKGRQIIIWRERPIIIVFTFKTKSVAWSNAYQIYSRLTAY
jgi:hypothetical protein